jgi:hypothetical protein
VIFRQEISRQFQLFYLDFRSGTTRLAALLVCSDATSVWATLLIRVATITVVPGTTLLVCPATVAQSILSGLAASRRVGTTKHVGGSTHPECTTTVVSSCT